MFLYSVNVLNFTEKEKQLQFFKDYCINHKVLHKKSSLGALYFEGRESLSFGKLTSKEWNNLFYKHIDHHFTQFGI